MIPPPPYKVVLLGELLVGKTLFVNRFTSETFDPHVSNTIGAAFITKRLTSNNHEVEFQIWDTAGQERYRLLTPMYYRNAKAAIVCVDLNDPGNLLVLAKYWLEQLHIHNRCDILLVGTKQDLATEENVEKFALENHLKLFKTSSKTGQGINQVFVEILDGIDEEWFEEYVKLKLVDLVKPAEKKGCC